MEQVMQLMATANLRAFKEPRGFIKVIQVIIAIFAFATTCGFESYTQLTVKCGTDPLDDKHINLPFSYPFRIDEDPITVPVCSKSPDNTTKIHPYGDYSASAQFYVFVGVVCFLYSLGTIILYVFFDEHYRKNDRIPIIDFIVSIVITLCWLISSSAWANGLSQLKFYTNPQYMINLHIPDCKDTVDKCYVSDHGNYAGLNVSIIFGFLNLGVWGGNLWFLFKETAWFKVRSKPAEADPNVPNVDPQQV